MQTTIENWIYFITLIVFCLLILLGIYKFGKKKDSGMTGRKEIIRMSYLFIGFILSDILSWVAKLISRIPYPLINSLLFLVLIIIFVLFFDKFIGLFKIPDENDIKENGPLKQWITLGILAQPMLGAGEIVMRKNFEYNTGAAETLDKMGSLGELSILVVLGLFFYVIARFIEHVYIIKNLKKETTQ